MDNKDIKALLDKFNAGNCTPAELELLQLLMQQDDEPDNSYIPDPALKARLWSNISKHTAPGKKISPFTQWLKVAAIVLLVITAGIFGNQLIRNKTGQRNSIAYQIITTPKGQIQQIVLPDSSMIHLNAASKIKIPLEFDTKKREVYLLEGEAFFEVKHDIKRPFLVHTAAVITQVLGTSFNIKFYKELTNIQVFVNSGKVEVHDQKHTLGMYTKQQQLIYNKLTQSFVKQQIDGDNALSWMHDELVFDNVPFKEIAIYLANRYAINFNYRSKRLNEQHYSLRFANKLTVNQVLDILQMADGRKYQLKNNTVYIK